MIRPLPGFAGDPRFGGRHGANSTHNMKIKRYLLNNGQNPPAREHLQMPEQRENSMGCMNVFFFAPVAQHPAVILVEPG